MASPERNADECNQRDIIRVPLLSGDGLRVLGVCAACAAFTDVTGLSALDAHSAIHAGNAAAHDEEPPLRRAAE